VRALIIPISILVAASPVSAQRPVVRVKVVPEFATVRPGSTFRVAVQLRVPDGWHIGWINPGRTGLPSEVSWQMPGTVHLDSVDWPYPELDDSGGLVSHVYRGEVTIVSAFHMDSVANERTADLAGELDWGICASVCVRQHRTVSLSLPVRTGPALRLPAWMVIEAADSLSPMRQDGLRLRATTQGDSAHVLITGLRTGPRPGSLVTFFPAEQGRTAVTVPVRTQPGGIGVTVPIRALRGSTQQHLIGLLVAQQSWRAGSMKRALAVDVLLSSQ
jgi:DsbC/DsbD-like thiol-disulfide interchange protein